MLKNRKRELWDFVPLRCQRTGPQSKRNEIIKSLCNKGAGARQLSQITGISYGIIQRVKE